MSQFIKSAILIKKEDRFLLVQENGKHAHGLWNWPQGKVEYGETIEQAAVRETKEETGLNIKIIRPIGILKDTFSDTKELHIFLGKIDSGLIHVPKEEILQAQWFTYQQIESMKDVLVGNWILKVIQDALKY